MLWRVPLSIIRSFSPYTQQWYVSYRFADSLQAISKPVWHTVASEEFFTVHTARVCHTGLLTACEVSANLYDIYRCKRGVFHCTHSKGMSYRFGDSLRGVSKPVWHIPLQARSFSLYTQQGYVIQVWWQLARCQQTCMTYTTASCQQTCMTDTIASCQQTCMTYTITSYQQTCMTYTIAVFSVKKLLMMDRVTVWNM